MKVIFITNVLPMKKVDELKLSTAGPKFSLSICKEFNRLLGNDNFDIVSLSRNDPSKKIGGDKLWEDRKYYRLKSVRYPIITHLIQGCDFVAYLFKRIKPNKLEKRAVLLLNSPAHISIPLVILKKICRLKIFSITIDTPFTRENSFKGLSGFYNKCYFKAGHLSLKAFNGILVHNKEALERLKLRIPYFVFLPGYDEDLYKDLYCYHRNNSQPKKRESEKRKLAYAGTFISFNGISELLEAFVSLDKDLYELHFYGYGPLERKIREYCSVYPNIIFHGRIDNMRLLEELKNMDLLINPRLTDNRIKYFTFPSKIVEYILTGKPVLTTRFYTMPPEYLNFVHIITEENPTGIKDAIQNVFKFSEEQLQKKCERGIDFVKKHQNYKSIVAQMYNFISSVP